jgi:Family of unknown function (DUF6064)
MSEWWTYRLDDFLMFAPRTYWRLIELYNRDLWPLQLLTLSVGAVLVGLAGSRNPRAPRAVLAGLALAWLLVAWAFHWQRYATINWGARSLAMAFLLQALLLLGAAVGMRGHAREARVMARPAGLLLAAAAVLLYPLIGIGAGRAIAQAEVFGLMPEPTALATVGLLLAVAPWRHAWLLVIPLLSLVVGALTLWLVAH